jgi:hypothetical protein
MRKTAFFKLLIILIVLLVLAPFRGAFSQSEGMESESQILLQLVLNDYPPNLITDIWVGNAGGYERGAFRPADEIQYIVVGENPYDEQISADLQWDQVGPCGSTQVFTATLSLEPGLWVHTHTATAPDCLGTYTNTAELMYGIFPSTRTTIFDVVTYTSEIVVSDQQGFDKCGLPEVNQMQVWWEESPYSVFNIYLGGSSFACNNPGLNADWVWEVSQQGWEYILTWVGPQSPCFNTIKPKISLDEAVAYQQGQDEADLAVAAADNLGLSGDKIIYYDIEGYTESQACRDAVDSFLTGWTARLHEKGFKAGAYGSPCRSFIVDWWDNNPRLDDIWIARWLVPAQYRPDVTVWGAVCGLTDAMWANNQRLRQYAGDHGETWGGVYIGGIDSDVLLGEITAITTTNASGSFQSADLQSDQSAQIQSMGLLTATDGWTLRGNQLWMTGDNGGSWEMISPEGVDQILGVEFIDPLSGWLVSLDTNGELLIHQTIDGGRSWGSATLPFPSLDVSAVYLDFVDVQTGWLVLKMVSGSSFSIGTLYATQDGGRTWDERLIPLGEPVHFSDHLNGWVGGGPTEAEFYRTQDGGKSWFATQQQAYLAATAEFQSSPSSGSLPDNTVQVSGFDSENAWTLTQHGSCSGEKNPASSDADPFQCWQGTQLWTTQDGGQTWQEIILD